MSTSTLTIQPARTTRLSRVVDYVELSKPRIALLVLVAVAVSYSLSRWGQPDPWTLVHVLLGTLLVAASASALNQWIERRRDALMERTAERPLPAQRLTGSQTMVFAGGMFLAGSLYLLTAVGWQPAFWGVLTWLVYVWIYTPLKPLTCLNTAVGAVAGALPVLIGWSAGGSYDLRAGSLFMLLFLWQFPHFMAIAWIYRKQYGRAGMKMLPVVEPTGRRAGVQAVLCALALIPVSVVPATTSPGLGASIYALLVLSLGLAQLACAVAFLRRRREETARRLLRASLLYLPAVLVLLTVVPWI